MDYYIPIKRASPVYKWFMYMDAADEYHADSLLQKNNVHAKFADKVWVSPDGRYRFVYCRVPKSEVGRFEKAISELPARMLLLGYDDYIDYWQKMMDFFDKNKRK